MILVPNDVKCKFCKRIFCCADCRRKHEQEKHAIEMAEEKHAIFIRSHCYLCNGEKLPLQEIPPEILQHIAEIHLPLSCNKCSRIFHEIGELIEVEKCCQIIQSPPEFVPKLSEILEENFGDSSPVEEEKQEKKEDKDIATPLTKINMRWRRKSREFCKTDSQEVGTLVRQTSTPMQVTSTAANFTDSSSYNASSIQISSINCISSSCSSESDEFSPPLQAPKQKNVLVTSPKINRSRPKLPVQATPLRQVMSKSIQRAIAEHGHYRNSPFVIQQRKMSFNSTNSSSECTMSYVKVPGGSESPLDLRMSPALRRVTNETKENNCEYQPEPGDLINFDSRVIETQNHHHIEIEHYEVVIRRSEIKSDSSAMTNYKSVFSDTGRSGSMPDFATPKIVGHNFFKKTISFETPEDEKTPGFLMPIEDDEENENENDDVFYTPRSSPVKTSIFRRASTDTIIPIDDDSQIPSGKSRNIWNLVSIVGENFKFKFKKPEFVKRAADYFAKRSSVPDQFPFKRRRTSSTSSNEVHLGSQSSPATKRQKIQGRKPINRMTRNLSLN